MVQRRKIQSPRTTSLNTPLFSPTQESSTSLYDFSLMLSPRKRKAHRDALPIRSRSLRVLSMSRQRQKACAHVTSKNLTFTPSTKATSSFGYVRSESVPSCTRKASLEKNWTANLDAHGDASYTADSYLYSTTASHASTASLLSIMGHSSGAADTISTRVNSADDSEASQFFAGLDDILISNTSTILQLSKPEDDDVVLAGSSSSETDSRSTHDDDSASSSAPFSFHDCAAPIRSMSTDSSPSVEACLPTQWTKPNGEPMHEQLRHEATETFTAAVVSTSNAEAESLKTGHSTTSVSLETKHCTDNVATLMVPNRMGMLHFPNGEPSSHVRNPKRTSRWVRAPRPQRKWTNTILISEQKRLMEHPVTPLEPEERQKKDLQPQQLYDESSKEMSHCPSEPCSFSASPSLEATTSLALSHPLVQQSSDELLVDSDSTHASAADLQSGCKATTTVTSFKTVTPVSLPLSHQPVLEGLFSARTTSLVATSPIFQLHRKLFDSVVASARQLGARPAQQQQSASRPSDNHFTVDEESFVCQRPNLTLESPKQRPRRTKHIRRSSDQPTFDGKTCLSASVNDDSAPPLQRVSVPLDDHQHKHVGTLPVPVLSCKHHHHQKQPQYLVCTSRKFSDRTASWQETSSQYAQPRYQRSPEPQSLPMPKSLSWIRGG